MKAVLFPEFNFLSSNNWSVRQSTLLNRAFILHSCQIFVHVIAVCPETLHFPVSLTSPFFLNIPPVRNYVLYFLLLLSVTDIFLYLKPYHEFFFFSSYSRKLHHLGKIVSSKNTSIPEP